MITILLSAGIALLPLLMPKLPGNAGPVDLVMGAFVALTLAAVALRRLPLLMPGAGALLPILLVSTASAALAVHAGTSLLTLVVEAYLLLLLWCAASVLHGRPDRLRVVMTVWAVAAVCWSAIIVGTHYGLLPTRLTQTLMDASNSSRAAGLAKNPNMAASYLSISFFVLLASPWPRHRPARFGAAVFIAFGVLATGSNAALAGIGAGLALIAMVAVLRRVEPRLRIAAGALTLSAVALLAIPAALLVQSQDLSLSQFSKTINQEGNPLLADSVGRASDGAEVRSLIWSGGWQVAQQRPLLGVGPGAATEADYSGPALERKAASGTLGRELHNDYLSFLVERGVLGALGLIALLVVVARWSLPLLRSRHVWLDGLERMRTPAALPAACFAVGLGAIFHESFHFRQVWLLLAVTWVASQLATGAHKWSDQPAQLGVSPGTPDQVSIPVASQPRELVGSSSAKI